MPDPLNDPARREAAVTLVRTFLDRVWGPSHDLGAIDDLMTEDYVITSGGTVLSGREAFRAWVAEFPRVLADARTVGHEEILDATGTRVVSR